MWSAMCMDTSIEPQLGKIRSLSSDSCKHIREVLATDCTNLPNSGVNWVQDMEVGPLFEYGVVRYIFAYKTCVPLICMCFLGLL